MRSEVLMAILVMAGVTYLIRVLPLVLIRKPITNPLFRSFLYYVPYVTLSVMTVPAILTATQSPISGTIGFVVAVVLAYKKASLIQVASVACAAVYLAELVL
ncbi:MAG: AzlD domain-containing protein [Erysipelotrichaceae bacterium]|nr:AzlD domain-containing protein [Erysipelotrichaceae bacterium]